MTCTFVRGRTPDSIDQRLLEAVDGIQTSTLGHLRDYGFPRGLTPLPWGSGFVGCAVTVRLPHMDSTALHVAVDGLRPGDVLVIDQGGDTRACLGGVVGYAAKLRGAVGAVVDGFVTDADELRELEFPVYSRGISARTTRILGIEGAINVQVCIGGVVVSPGAVVIADSDGVAVVDRSDLSSLVESLHARQDREPPLKDLLAGGQALSDISGARRLFAGGSGN